jgi:hypothetical protein
MPDTESSKTSNDNSLAKPPFSWRDIGAREHFVQFYENDSFLVDCVAEYIAQGLAAKENAIVIATIDHHKAIADRLRARNIDVGAAVQRCQYIQCDAEEVLSTFMADGMPDESRFNRTIDGLFGGAARNGKGLRIFGEMVALLLTARNVKAAIRLEEMWNTLAKKHDFSLFCGYPAKGPCDVLDGQLFSQICKEHSCVLPSKPDASVPADFIQTANA